MAEASVFSKFWNNSKTRNLTILAILLITMVICLKSCYDKMHSYEPTQGSARAFICPDCDYHGKEVTIDAGQIQCPECKTKVGFAWKCKDCGREFAIKQTKITKVMTKKELMEKKKLETQCPNCSSQNTYPLAK